MTLFFLFFFSVYGGMHAYVFFRTRSALGLGTSASIGYAIWMIIMVFIPVVIRMLERAGYELSARAGSYIGYLWMGALFLFVCIALVLDGINLSGRVAGWIMKRDFLSVLIPTRLSFFISLGLAVTISIYGYFEALNIRTEQITIQTPKLPSGVDRLRIVQISDVHLGLIVRERRLDRMLTIVKQERPDIFVSTGDLVDAQINTMHGFAEKLCEIEAPHGKFAVTGNHEYYAGLTAALAFTKTCGFTLLQGTGRSGIINIAGVNDPTGVRMGLEKPVSEKVLLAGLPRDKFTLLLKHQPRIDPEARGLFDLQLSGHTHKGQIFPFTYLSAIPYPMNAGRFDLDDRSVLYVSRGTGTWGPPIRFLAPPQVTVITLVRAGR